MKAEQIESLKSLVNKLKKDLKRAEDMWNNKEPQAGIIGWLEGSIKGAIIELEVELEVELEHTKRE